MTDEQRKSANEYLDSLSKIENLSVDNMTGIDGLRTIIADDETEKQLAEWQQRYSDMEASYSNLAAENSRIINAYRERWDAATNGTMVNGVYVDKTVTRVTDYSYEKLMKGE